MTSSIYNSPIGPLLIAEEDGCITEISFMAADTREKYRKETPPTQPPTGVIAACIAELEAYFAGKLQDFTIPINLTGTDFRKRVWAALMTIPYGQTISYKELAQRIGQPSAMRAVGGANNHNPISIIVPCHRVIGANGALVGYGGGLDKKQFLLEHEKRTCGICPH